MLPLQCSKVKGALVGRSVEVRKQGEIQFNCQGCTFVANFIVVPSLAVDALLGVEFSVAHQATMNFGEAEVRLLLDGSNIKLKFDECTTTLISDGPCCHFLSDSLTDYRAICGADPVS